jgi:archaellin
MINIHNAIIELYPQVVSIRGDIAYDINNQEVKYDKKSAQDYVDSQAYKQKRQAEYPPMSDYLDAVVKDDKAQMQSYIDACLAVKLKYPKPQ